MPEQRRLSDESSSGLVTVTPGSTGALNNKTVTNATGLTSDPTVDFGFVLPPTAIQLENFEAYTDGSTVSLKWSTGGESGNLGFNVYREVNGKRELINSAPIAGSALRSSVELLASGESYDWNDDEPKSGVAFIISKTSTSTARPLYTVRLRRSSKFS